MKLIHSAILFLSVLLQSAYCQVPVHYVPAQVLIPVLNNTYWVANSSAVNSHRPGYNGNYPNGNYQPNYHNGNHQPNYNNNQPPGYYQYNTTNSRQNNTWNNHQPIGWRNDFQNVSQNYSGKGHLIVGNIQPYDRLLFNQEYFKDSRWWTGREKIIDYPGDVPGGYVRHETISAIRAYNKFYQGTSAKATILKGGVGQQFVRLKLESPRNHGLKFLVQIFGH